MRPRQKPADLWIDWFFVHFHHVTLALMVVALLAIGVATCQLKHSVTAVEESIAEQLRFRPRPSADKLASSESHDAEHQLVYVPAHSHAYGGEGEALLLTITLTVRNTDMSSRMQLHSVKYFDTAGSLVREFVSEPLQIRPLETLEYLVPESDIRGGSGANFIVEWSSPHNVNPPIVEALMIGSSNGLGISFVQRGSAMSPIPPAGASTASNPSDR